MRKMQSNESYWIGIFDVDFRLLLPLSSSNLLSGRRESHQLDSLGANVCFEFMYVDKYEMSMIKLLLNLNACIQYFWSHLMNQPARQRSIGRCVFVVCDRSFSMRLLKFYVMLRVCVLRLITSKIDAFNAWNIRFLNKIIALFPLNAVAQYLVSFVIVLASVGRLIKNNNDRKRERESGA